MREVLGDTDRAYEFLDSAARKLDEPLKEALETGSVRLLRCAWLHDRDRSDAVLRRPNGDVALMRQQDLLEIQRKTGERIFFSGRCAGCWRERVG